MQGRTCVSARPKRADTQVRPYVMTPPPSRSCRVLIPSNLLRGSSSRPGAKCLYFSLMLIPAGPAVSWVPDCSDISVITTPLSLIMVSSPEPPATAKVAWLAI
jgi:hypothetical protein